MLVFNPLVPRFFAWHASRPPTLQRLLHSTGSRLSAEGQALYGRLVADPAHVGGVLAMMAQWDLRPLLRDLPRLACPLHLVAAAADHTVPPAQAQAVARLVPGAQVHRLAGLGHLAHEEAPDHIARLLQKLTAHPD
jgi:magnesium chelatase accessory protein